MKKNKIITILCFVLVLSLFLVVGCGKETEDGLKVKETDIITVTNEIVAYRGSMCELPYATAEQNGVIYPVNVQVKDKDGNFIPVVNNSFYVEFSEYTARYYTVIDEIKLVKTVPITVKDVTNDSLIIKGKLEHWMEPGEFSLSSISATVQDYYGETIGNDNLTAKLFDIDDREINLVDGKANLSSGKYVLKYATEKAVTVNSIGIFVSEKKFDSLGRLIYADFADENHSSLFATDYVATYKSENNVPDPSKPILLTKSWEIRRNTWEVIFLSDGFADFSNGGKVSFDSVVGYMNVDCKVNYYPADGSKMQVLGDYKDLPWYAISELSFVVPENGTLVGAKLEFVLPTTELWGHFLGNFTVDYRNTIGDKKAELIVPNDDIDLANLGVVVQNPGKTPITEGVTFKVSNGENEVLPKENGKYDFSNEGLYIIKPYVDNVAVYEDFKLIVREPRCTIDGKYVFFSMKSGVDEMDQYLIGTDFPPSIEGAYWQDPVIEVGIGKNWATPLSNWTYTFLNNGSVDISNGATVYFDTSILYDSRTYNASILLKKPNGQTTMIGSMVDDYQKHTFSFELQPGESLAGCQLNFICSGTALGNSISNVLIDVKLPYMESENFVLTKTGDFDLTSIKVFDVDGNEQTEGITYVVTENGSEIQVVNGKIAVENQKTYEVKALLSGSYVKGSSIIYVKDLTPNNDMLIQYMNIVKDSDETDRVMLNAITHTATIGMNYGGDVQGLLKDYGLGLSKWSYEFNANASFENGAVVSFDSCVAAWGTYPYTVKLTRVNGQTEVLGTGFGNHAKETFSFALNANEQLKGLIITFESENSGLGHIIGNVIIDLKDRMENQDTEIVKAGEFDLLNINVISAGGIKITSGIVYSVTENNNPVSITNGKIIVEEKKTYVVTATVNGNLVNGSTKIYGKDLTPNTDGVVQYMSIVQGSDETDRVMLNAITHTVTIGQNYSGEVQGLLKDYALGLSKWSYEFNANLSFENGAVVSFDSSVTAWGTFPYTVKLTRANGQTEVLGTGLGNHAKETFSFALSANEQLNGLIITFESANNQLGHVIGNISIKNTLDGYV